ncbi:MAG TPA: class II glutamine amidotransferase [Pseudonocardiaceae bacterium]|nr:class II glutamine amidotransferase [Pseudonocardiaceae bacterium]
MCRLVGWVASTPVTLQDVLGRTSVERFAHLSRVHSDGWGAAWHDAHGALTVTRSGSPAGADPGFTGFASRVAATAALVHLRLGTPGCGHGPLNTHPFTDGPWALAHNGAFAPGERIDLLLEPGQRRAAGETDTERYFLALRAELARNGGSVPAAVDHVLARMARVGLTASSLNALLLGTDALHVISSHDADWRASDIPVWPADELASGVVLPPYFPMIYTETEHAVVAASSGIVSDQDGWAPIPNHAVLRIETGSLRTAVTGVSPAVPAP